MNLCLFFEGTGQGVAGKVTNVTRLRDICVDDVRQKLHLEAGPGTHFGSYLAGKIAGVGWRTADFTMTTTLSPTLLLRGSRLVQSERDCVSNAPPGFRNSSTYQPSSCTTPTTRPRISGARSTAPAAIYPESDCTSLAKDSERMCRLKN